MATPKKKEYILNEGQESLILENFGRGITDINLLTKLVTGNEKKDGRDIEGVAVKKFLIGKKLDYKTKHNATAKPAIELTEDQKIIVKQSMFDDKSSLQIAKEIFGEQVAKLSQEQRAVLAYIREVNPDYKPEVSNTATTYYAPSDINRVVKEINDAVGINLDPEKISGKYKQYIDRLRVNLGTLRFVRICNSYTNNKDRDLFKQQFVLLTWDKPDLSADELNLYMNVCKDIVNGEILTSHINTLNAVFENMGENQDEFTVRFAETLKSKTGEYQDNQKRVSDTIKKLQGDRADRLKSQGKDDTNFITIVQLAQDEKERQNMLRLAELQRAAIQEEANRLESMDDFRCRIMGVSKEDVI